MVNELITDQLLRTAIGNMLLGNDMFKQAILDGTLVFQLDTTARTDTGAGHGEVQVYRDAANIYVQVWDREAAAWRTIRSFAFSTTEIADIAATEGAGTSATVPRGDHVHAHPVFSTGDLHSEYRLESADHSHVSTGLQGGTVSHADLATVTANQHHAQAHGAADHTNRTLREDIPLRGFNIQDGTPVYQKSAANTGAVGVWSIGTNETIDGHHVIPSDYNSGGTYNFVYRMATATTGAVRLRANWRSQSEGASVETPFSSVALTDTVQATAANAGFAQLDPATTFTAGAFVSVNFGRLAHAEDTAAGDMELLGVFFEYTADM